MEAYQKLAIPLNSDPDYLSGLSIDELQALAEINLAIASQSRLDELLVKNSESQLSPDEIKELDRLIVQVDQLTILKTRARYTLIGRVTIEALKMNRVQLVRVRKMWVKLGEHPPKLR